MSISYAPVFYYNKIENGKAVFSRAKEVYFGTSSCYFEGCGVINGTLVKDEKDLRGELIAGFNFRDSWNLCSGSYCAYIKRNDCLEIYPDPLGACLLFKYEDEKVIAYSSDMNELLFFIDNELCAKVEPDIFYLALLLKVGNGAYGYTSYKDIKVIDSRVCVTITDQGVSEEVFFDFRCDELKESNYEYYRDCAIADIKRNVKAVQESSIKNVICHITGGFDSRLVAAEIARRDFSDKIYFFCSGPINTLDKKIAYGLAHDLNWKVTDFNGLICDGYSFEDELDFLKKGVGFASGMRANCVVNENHNKTDEFIILSGGYGECLRSFYSHRAINEDLSSILKKNSLLTSGVEKRVEVLTKKYLDDYVLKGLRVDQALDLMYVEQRNRYFVGNIATLFSRKTPRLDPLYSINGVKASLCLKAKERADNRLGFDIMKEINKRFLGYSFNSKKFGDSVFEYNDIKKSDMLKSVADYDNELHKHIFKEQCNSGYKRVMSKEDVDYANKIKASPWQVSQYSKIQDACNKLVVNIEDDGCLDKNYISDILKKEKPQNRVELRDIFSLYSFLSFFEKNANKAIE